MDDNATSAAPTATLAPVGGGTTPSPPPRLEALGGRRHATPETTTRRTDSIASQFQREILGELTTAAAGTPQSQQLPTHSRDTGSGSRSAATTNHNSNDATNSSASSRDDIQIRTPETFTARGAAAASATATATASATSHDHRIDNDDITEETKENSDYVSAHSPYALRRTTLSPSTASLLADADSAISRRNTVSPQALKSLLQGISLDDASPNATAATAATKRSEHATPSPSSSTTSSDSDSSAANRFLAAAVSADAAPRTPEATRAAKRKQRDNQRTLSPSEVLNLTLGDLSPVVRRQEEVDAAAAMANEHNDGESLQRRTTLEPTDAADFLAELRDELPTSNRSTTTSTNADASSSATKHMSNKRRQTLATATPFELDVSPVTRFRARRATVDTSDMRTAAVPPATPAAPADGDQDTEEDDGAMAIEDAHDQQLRRATVDADDVRALHAELHTTDDDDAHASRKRSAADTTSPSPRSKRPRESAVASPPRTSTVSTATRESTGLARPQKTPTPAKPPRSVASGSTGGRTLERQSLLAKFSSPPAIARSTSSTKTPLRSILSAKKPLTASTSASMSTSLSTPLKSVNFGPSQGAEFHAGSPSTSMTPMLAKDARRLFPLDRAASPPLTQFEMDVEEEDDDEETSLNTSLLDDADAIDSDNDLDDRAIEESEEEGDGDTIERLEARLGIAPVGARAAAASPPTDKPHRRFSLRGVSPMQNQANARRLRRASLSHSALTAPSVVVAPSTTLKGIGPNALDAQPAAAISKPAPRPQTSSVFLSDDPNDDDDDNDNDALPPTTTATARPAYADSSASSDAGDDDMEITGDFSAFVQASGLLTASAQKAAETTRFRSRAKDDGAAVAAASASVRQFNDNSLQGDGDTVELGSLGDLLAESAAYANDKNRDTSADRDAYDGDDGDDGDALPTLGSLRDLARESDAPPPPRRRSLSLGPAATRRFNSLAYSQLDEQDVTLDPIQEEDEDDAANASSNAPSTMDIDTSDDDDEEDEDDAEYDARRKSLVVNLSAKFARVGSASPKPRAFSSTTVDESESPPRQTTAAALGARIRSPLRRSPRRRHSVAAAAASTSTVSMGELLARAGVDVQATALSSDMLDNASSFCDLYASSLDDADVAIDGANDSDKRIVDTVKRAAIATACRDVVQWHSDELTAWSNGLTDQLASLLQERAPPVFANDDNTAAGSNAFVAADANAIRMLYALETASVHSGLCQWRTNLEREVADKLAGVASELDKDVASLTQRALAIEATRARELEALDALLLREQQMAGLLDAIDEQQGIQNEYAAKVDALETKCAAMSLEASVLRDQLRVAESIASESNLVSPDVVAELERQVLYVEDVSAIQSGLSLWRTTVATASHLQLRAHFDDVLLRVVLDVDVVLSDVPSGSAPGSTMTEGGGFSTNVTSSVTLKRRRRPHDATAIDADIVRLVQQKLFDPIQLSRFIRTTNSSQHDVATTTRRDAWLADRPQRVCALLQELERYAMLSFRFLRELRTLSTQYAVEYIVDGSVLWVEFLNFAPSHEAKFVVGFALLDEFPYTNFETSVDVVHGAVSADAIRAEIEAEAAKQLDYDYISRICERLWTKFVGRR